MANLTPDTKYRIKMLIVYLFLSVVVWFVVAPKPDVAWLVWTLRISTGFMTGYYLGKLVSDYE